jgi:hypothetical protein
MKARESSMDRRRSTAPTERNVRARGALTTFLEADAERPRRVDSYIDYFGSGEARRASISSGPGGKSLLDGHGAR